MAEEKVPKSGRWRSWRERWRAHGDHAREVEARLKLAKADAQERADRMGRTGPGSGTRPA
jgi:hypothetical protein